MSQFSQKEIGNRLRALRKAKGLGTQGNVAILLGTTTNAYNNWETGVHPIPVPFAIKLCSFTGASLDYIFRGEMASLPANLVTLLSTLDAPPKTRKQV